MNTKPFEHEVKENIIKIAKQDNILNKLDYSKILFYTFTDENFECGFYGKVETKLINNDLYFDVLINDKFINYSESEKAISISLHELFHCYEISITSKYINWKQLYFNHQFDNTHDLILDLAYHNWSEYFAYINTCKYHKRLFQLKPYIEMTDISLRVLKENAIKDGEAMLYDQAKNNIDNYIHNLILVLAHYNYSKDEKYIIDILNCKNTNYDSFYRQAIKLIPKLNELYTNYPNWVNEETLLSFGKQLTGIIKYYHLGFSTEDLSDNFIFKYIP